MINYSSQANVAITRSSNGGFVITVVKKSDIKEAGGISVPQYSLQEHEVFTASGIDDAVNIIREILSGLQT